MPGKKKHKRILVAPLNWGLGHASRCIPIINSLIENDFQPILAGDGVSLELLRKEFPQLKYYKLPSYNIKYTRQGADLKLKLFLQAPGLIKSIIKERSLINTIVKNESIDGIISDNRFGVWSQKVPSVYITHQLRVLSGSTTWLTTKLHARIFSKFDECWIPDQKTEKNLSGEMSRNLFSGAKIKFIGPLSRFSKQDVEKDIDLLIILSGPEPQREILEKILRKELMHFNGKCVLVRGLISDRQNIVQKKGIRIVDFMLKEELETYLNRSKLVISRSGYSSIMDLNAIGAKAFFIPTPGQYEQHYLAKRLKELALADFVNQESFSLEEIQNSKNYKGFGYKKTSKTNLSVSLFDVFN